MSEAQVPGAMVVDGWTLLQDPVFAEGYEDIVATVERLREKHPEIYRKKAPTKMLVAIEKLTKEVISADPTSSAFDLATPSGRNTVPGSARSSYSSFVSSSATTRHARSSSMASVVAVSHPGFVGLF